jgi:hypothetical protein
MDPSGSTGADASSSSGPSCSSSVTADLTEKSSNAAIQEDYSFACQSVISTGHTQNVFNAHMLPFSTRM